MVRVSIGRIEVHAAPPAASRPAEPSSPQVPEPLVSLERYLADRWRR